MVTMESGRFDALARSFSTTDTRRALLRLLAQLPLAAGFAALLGEGPDAGAQQDPERGSSHRHHRRRARNRHDPGQNKDHRKGKRKKQGRKKGNGQTPPPGPAPQPSCVPESKAQTCAGKCASVTNNCGTLDDCGACSCHPSCGECFTCDPATGECIVDATQGGDACGEPGQVCQADGRCACNDGSCGSGRRCAGGQCICDATSCPTGCCDEAEVCHIDEDAACGTGGGRCADCTSIGDGQRCGGGGTPGACGCENDAAACAGHCGNTTVNNCGQPVSCPCSDSCLCPGTQECLSNGSCAAECDGGLCATGCSCGDSSAEGPPRCVVPQSSCDGISQTCTSTTECPLGQHCQETQCPWPSSRCVPLCTA